MLQFVRFLHLNIGMARTTGAQLHLLLQEVLKKNDVVGEKSNSVHTVPSNRKAA